MISVIVPVYNVADYLHKCLDSILCQSYNNLEIILVNDGSTDDSSSICRECKDRDNRVILIEKENGGLSSARNAGLAVAKGEYVGFIDSDDWISPCMFQELIQEIKHQEADVSICGYNIAHRSGRIKQVYLNAGVYQSTEVLIDLLSGRLKDYACNKLYRRALFQGIEYPEGKTFEDISTTHKVLGKAQRIVIINKALYYYRQRKESITQSISLNNAMDRCNALYERYNMYRSVYPMIKAQMIIQVFNSMIAMADAMAKTPPEKCAQYQDYINNLIQFISTYKELIIESYTGKIIKIKLYFMLRNDAFGRIMLSIIYNLGRFISEIKLGGV